MQILPFAYAQVVEEIGTAQFAELVAGQGLLLLGQVFPQVQQGQEVAGRVREARMLCRKTDVS